MSATFVIYIDETVKGEARFEWIRDGYKWETQAPGLRIPPT